MVATAEAEAKTCESCGCKGRDRVVTVRMPAELHKALKKESYHREISMNQLCLAMIRSYVPVPIPSDQDPDSE